MSDRFTSKNKIKLKLIVWGLWYKGSNTDVPPSTPTSNILTRERTRTAKALFVNATLRGGGGTWRKNRDLKKENPVPYHILSSLYCFPHPWLHKQGTQRSIPNSCALRRAMLPSGLNGLQNFQSSIRWLAYLWEAESHAFIKALSSIFESLSSPSYCTKGRTMLHSSASQSERCTHTAFEGRI